MTDNGRTLIRSDRDLRQKYHQLAALSRLCSCLLYICRRRLANGVAAAMPQASEPAAGGRCTRTGLRRAAAAVVPAGSDVVAVRISAPGWEDAVLDGLQVSPSQF